MQGLSHGNNKLQEIWFEKIISNNKATVLYIYFILFYFLERGERKEKERERNISVREKHESVASHTPPAGDMAHNPGMCPDWESNPQPSDLQASTQCTEPHQPGQKQKCNIN